MWTNWFTSKRYNREDFPSCAGRREGGGGQGNVCYPFNGVVSEFHSMQIHSMIQHFIIERHDKTFRNRAIQK